MKRKLLIALFAAVSLAGQSQEDVWQKCNESLPADIRIKPSRCSDNTHESDGIIKYTQDGDINTQYHSQYIGKKFVVSAENPAELTFDFKKVKCIDYLEYVPRQAGENGIVLEAEIYVKTATDKDYRLYEHCEWKFNYNTKRVVFKGGLQKPVSIKFRILKGVGDFGSCAEMKFMKEEKENLDISVFADDLLTTLKPQTTKADIKKIKQPLLRQLAQELLQGTYATDYRVASYECYNHPVLLAKEWRTPNKHYDQFQGVTGIVIKPGKHLVMASGIPDSVSAYMNVVAWYTEKEVHGKGPDQAEITTQKLHNGINIINYDRKLEGLAYISYFSKGYADANPPIRVHFVGGTVNGYLTPDKTNEQMHQMTATAPYRLIDVLSKKVHAVWPTDGLHEHCKADDGVSPGYRQYMNILDTLMTWEQRLVGLEKYGRIPRNRTLLSTSFFYPALCSTPLGISIPIKKQQRYVNCQKILKDDSETVWGMSHEWGHQHQINPFFCWAGIREVSNNLNSYYNVMHMGYKYEQLQEEKRKGMEEGIRHYLEDDTEDCLFEVKNIYDHAFERLGPFVRLCNFFMNEGGKPDFLPDLYEALRHSEVKSKGGNIVPYVLNFIRTASDVSGYNLLPYFLQFGFLRAKDFWLNDYGIATYKLSQEEIDAFCKEMEVFAQEKHLQTMPEGMIERIAHTPDVEYGRPHFAN